MKTKAEIKLLMELLKSDRQTLPWTPPDQGFLDALIWVLSPSEEKRKKAKGSKK